ncbi:MAG: hypothetical protein AUJ07_07390 [Crenarchaeota archaeon 13_1_40CM_3_53_5]|nr:MAG: hypothetical protein AUJ07_07390 [Crenarchaeota archaeon 13_1_40CM_3_53_5]
MNRDDGVYGVEVHQTTQRLLAQGLPEAAFFRGRGCMASPKTLFAREGASNPTFWRRHAGVP